MNIRMMTSTDVKALGHNRVQEGRYLMEAQAEVQRAERYAFPADIIVIVGKSAG